MAHWRFKSNGQSISVWQPNGVICKGLIIISHGAGGSMLDHRGTAKKLSNEGWVICAPLHKGDNFRDKSQLGTDAYWFNRPHEISQCLDAVLAHPRLSNLIDSECIGAIGFSAGGYSVLAAAGGKPSLSKLKKHCEDPSNDPRFCGFGDKAKAYAEIGDWRGSHISDDRIKALVLVAPVGAVFNEGALDSVNSDVLLIRAGADQILSSPYHAENIHHLLKDDNTYETIDDLHHFGFIEPFPWYLKTFGIEAAKDPKGYQRRKNLDLINSKIITFLTDRLT